MIPTITAGGTDMRGCRHGRRRKKINLRYIVRTGEVLLINAHTEQAFMVYDQVLEVQPENMLLKCALEKQRQW